MKENKLITDLGDVFLKMDRNIYLKVTNRFFEERGIDLKLVEKVDKEIFDKRLRKAARIGKLSYKAAIKEFFKALEVKNFRKIADEYIQFEVNNLKKWMKVVPNSRMVLRRVKSMGVKIIILSDCMQSISERKRELQILGLSEYFDEIYTSNSLGVEKPEAFKYFRPKEGERVIFFGHDDDEILGAKKFNLVTIGLCNKNADFSISSIKYLPLTIRKIFEV